MPRMESPTPNPIPKPLALGVNVDKSKGSAARTPEFQSPLLHT